MTRAAVLALLLLAGCGGPRAADRPLEVSVIGGAAGIVDPSRAALTSPAAALLGATAQGLVSFDQSGQVQPGLAERWIVSEEGRSLIFRLRDLKWADGAPATTADVARALRAMIAPRSRNPLKPLLGAIDDIDAVTPQVVEIDLVSPRPNLLQLLAQPETALLRGVAGTGPMRGGRSGGVVLLHTLPDPDADPGDPTPPPDDVRLRGEDAAHAVARFMTGRSDVVLGGTFADLAIARAMGRPLQQLRFDPVRGLFGFAFTNADPAGLAADPVVRAALAMAVDRDRIATMIAAPGWTPQIALVPQGTSDLGSSALPDWSERALADRRAAARAAIAAWIAAHGAPSALRVAIPDGPDARMLFALVAQDWQAIGVSAVAVAPGAPADLVLIDRVAPGDSASFYLRSVACVAQAPCAPDAEAALDAARTAPTLAARADALAVADRALVAVAPFIAIAEPLRWSLVGSAADGWHDNPRAVHPLATLHTPARQSAFR